jgi:hypothetical protein
MKNVCQHEPISNTPLELSAAYSSIVMQNRRLMKFTLIILILALVVSCKYQTEKKSIDSESKEQKIDKSNKIINDTINSSFPVRIGNDKGSVKIVGQRKYENKKLTTSNFVISLVDITNLSLSKRIDKSILIDQNKIIILKDTINSDYLDSAIIKNIEFDFVRANTLYFNAILENPIEGKEIIGRFNLFYRTKKKGTVYGWTTDEIKETLHNTIYSK